MHSKGGQQERGIKDKRKYVIVCNEHSGMWRGTLLFWGERTEDNEKRSFGGYTSDVDKCEMYSEKDLEEKGCTFPKYHKGMTLKEFLGYSEILIEPDQLQELGYRSMKVLFRP